MKIVVLMGSPNKNGSTRILVDSFVQGAESAGHTCEVVDVCHANVHPCIGCVRCGYEGPCVQKDDVETIRGEIAQFRYGRLCHSALLLRHDCTAKSSCGSFLRVQQQLKQQASEICSAHGCMERG